MSLHTVCFGEGPDLVLVHGWAMHSGMWWPFAQRLASRFRVTLVDLPGHGFSGPKDAAGDLRTWTDAVAAVTPATAWWCGWSLGVQLSLTLAHRYPERVRGIVAIAGTPRFVRAPDWRPAIAAERLANFAAELAGDYERTLRRFLALQVLAANRSAPLLRQLRSAISAAPAPSPQALASGLAILETTDLRGRLASLPVPLLWMLGARDTLVPASLASALTTLCPAAGVELIGGAGHAPFLSHADVCVAAIDRLVAGALPDGWSP